MKKKIICLVSAALLSVFLFCMPALAYTQLFTNYFQLSYISVGSLPSSAYHSIVNQEAGQMDVKSADGSDFGDFSFIHIYMSYFGPTINAGDRFVGTFYFVVSDYASNGKNPNSPPATASFQAKINGDSFTPIGTVTLESHSYDTSINSNLYRFRVDFDYYFDTAVERMQCSIGVNFNGFKPKTPHMISAKFLQIENFYLGAANAPEAPNYKNPNQNYGSELGSTNKDVENYKDSEEAILNETEKGRNEAFQLFNTLSDTVGQVSHTLLAVTYGLNYFIGGSTLLNSILYISLTLGFVLFIFNAVPSLSRSRAGSEPRSKKKGDGS